MGTKRYIIHILISFIWLCCGSNISAHSTIPHKHGLQFAAYSVNPDNRTSLEIPYGKEGIRFRNYLSVSLDMRVIMEQEKFGYIARIILDGTKSVDVYLRNRGGRYYICLITEGAEIGTLIGTDTDVAAWNRITVTLESENGNTAIRGNGVHYGSIALEGRSHYAKICLGAVHISGFSSTDCAPVIVKDLSVSTNPSKTNCRWTLSQFHENQIIDSDYGKCQAFVSNPVWTVKDHISWQQVFSQEFDGKIFPVIDAERDRCFFISGDGTAEYVFTTGEYRTSHSSHKVNPGKITNNFITSPDGKKIIYYDFDKDGQFASCDISSGEWDRDVSRQVHSRFLHNNSFISPADSSIVQMFGYGFHLYTNKAYIRSREMSVTSCTLDSIAPRYLSSVYVSPEQMKAYVLGGRGNRTGIQEYGIESFSDLWEVDLNNFECTCITPYIDTENEIATPTFYMDRDSQTITGLFFFPGKSNTALHLRTIDIKDNSSRIAGNDIPFLFIDKDSFADIYINEESGDCYAIVADRESERFRAKIYRISLPVVSSCDMKQEDSPWYLFLISAVAVCIFSCGAAILLIRRRNGKNPDNVTSEENAADANSDSLEPVSDDIDYTAPGIYLLNGFRVTDKDGKDISKNFAPTMRLLLSLIILYTQKYGGISNAELKEYLWFDKSDSSYFNNRSVLLHKIRAELEQVTDNLVIKSKNNRWLIETDENVCDYIKATNYLDTIKGAEIEDAENLIAIARRGNLLSFIDFEGFDKFKGEYSDRIIGLLTSLRDSRPAGDNDRIRMSLCECIMLFDTLDEDSLRIICKTLIKHKQITKAQNRFSLFRKEYQKIMDEEFTTSFKEFLKG